MVPRHGRQRYSRACEESRRSRPTPTRSSKDRELPLRQTRCSTSTLPTTSCSPPARFPSSIGRRTDRREPRPLKKADVVGASLLFHPVRHLATSLEEWIRYPSPDRDATCSTQGRRPTRATSWATGARTENTTVTFMPATPEWLIDEYAEMIEFVASIPPLLTLWENRAQAPAPSASSRPNDRPEHDDAGDDPIRAALQARAGIRELESDIGRSSQTCARRRSAGHARTGSSSTTSGRLQACPTSRGSSRRRLTRLAERQERIATLVSSIDQRIRREAATEERRAAHEEMSPPSARGEESSTTSSGATE